MSIPLAQQLRPQTIDEVVGQRHLIGENKPLRNIIESGELPNMIFYGPSGVGKTTVASIIAKATDRKLCKLNGTNASIADIRNIVAQIDTVAAPNAPAAHAATRESTSFFMPCPFAGCQMDQPPILNARQISEMRIAITRSGASTFTITT